MPASVKLTTVQMIYENPEQSALARNAEPAIDVLAMDPDRSLGNVHHLADRKVAVSPKDQPHDVALLLRQPV